MTPRNKLKEFATVGGQSHQAVVIRIAPSPTIAYILTQIHNAVLLRVLPIRCKVPFLGWSVSLLVLIEEWYWTNKLEHEVTLECS